MTTATKWDPAEFHYWYSQMHGERKARALNNLLQDQRKLYGEWLTFREFAPISSLDIDPRTIQNCLPPEPDIRCRVSGALHYFELGEVTDQGLAREAGIAAKQGQDIFGGSLSQLGPLRRIFEQKQVKTYSTSGHPLDLLLYYRVGHQYPNTAWIKNEIGIRHQEIVTDLRKGPFRRLWLYDGWEKEVIACIEG
jgi:hypothetical protein